MIKAKSILIQKFRSFVPNEEFVIGDRITLIAGQNGTQKSTLLGMICQPLGFPDPKQGKKRKADSRYTRVYNDLKLWEYTTLAERPFKAVYSDVFRMSKRKDKPHTHESIIMMKHKRLHNTARPSLILFKGIFVRPSPMELSVCS
jgi:predicted ATPase